MSNYCPEWILGVAVGVIVGDALTGNTSILANSQKYSEGLSKHYEEVSKDFLNDWPGVNCKFITSFEKKSARILILKRKSNLIFIMGYFKHLKLFPSVMLWSGSNRV